jgi:DNA-binding transcriptional MerR regulator
MNSAPGYKNNQRGLYSKRKRRWRHPSRQLRKWGGLLRPSGRSEGGFRLYSVADVTRLLVIRRMKPLGFTLDEMSEVMRLLEVLGTGNDEAPDVDRLSELEQVIARAEERRETLRRQVEMADEFIEALRGQPGDATGR